MGKRAKVVNVVVSTFGNYLGIDKGCIILRDKNKKEQKYPLFEAEIGEVVLTSGNLVSTGALSALGFWGIDVLIATRNGRPIAMLKNLEDDSHVKTRISQYEALNNGKGIEFAKQVVISKVLGQNQVLKKYGLRQHDLMSAKEAVNGMGITNLTLLRKKLLHIEGKFSQSYFEQIFQMFPYDLRPENRRGYQAYDGINNLFNLAYELLFWKCYKALSKAHLETHLGFVHVLLYNRPSLVCDFEELYRYLVDDFLLTYAKKLRSKDFIAKAEMFNDKKGKRIYLNKTKTDDLTDKLHDYFRSTVNIPRIMRGDKQEIETLISEEALLLAKYFRGEKPNWIPRIA
jgi:CRISP-associated protein Cas1